MAYTSTDYEQWLEQLTKDRGNVYSVAAYCGVTKGKLHNKILQGPCHVGLSGMPIGTEYIVSLNQLTATDRRYPEEWMEAWVDWLVNLSPFKDAFVHHSRLGYVVRTDMPGNYITAALMMTRQPWESRNTVWVKVFWKPLVDAGVNPTLASVVCLGIKQIKRNLYTFNGEWSSGHYPISIDTTKVSVENYLKHTKDKPTWCDPSPLLSKKPKYFRSPRICGLWGVYGKEYDTLINTIIDRVDNRDSVPLIKIKTTWLDYSQRQGTIKEWVNAVVPILKEMFPE